METVNPLRKHFRQPSIYIKLPSKGQFWPDDAISIPANGELAVYSMTVRDEITLKTPDALLNGAGVISVIESCVPSISDAWQIPSIDVDKLIIAIRIATYGHDMDFDVICPKCKTENSYGIDLRNIIDTIKAPDYSVPVEVDGLKIYLKPQPYFVVNEAKQMEFEEQQLLRLFAADDMDPELRKAEFSKHLERMVTLTRKNLVMSIRHIETPDGDVVSNTEFIDEFFINADASVNKAVNKRLAEHSKTVEIQPIDVKCDNEDCGHQYKVNLTFDFATFFAKGF